MQRHHNPLGLLPTIALLLAACSQAPQSQTPQPVPDTIQAMVACDVPALIAAINSANANPDPSTIDLAAGCTYVLTAANNSASGPNGLPIIATPVTINGNGATITRSNNAGKFRIFFVESTGSLTLNSLTVSRGDGGDTSNGGGFGGGIFNNAGTLILNSSTVASNTVSGESVSSAGGGIFNLGTATLTNSAIIRNSATEGNGAGIFNGSRGELTLINSTVSENTAVFDSAGGGIRSLGNLTLINSTISANTALVGGGVFNDNGTLTIGNTLIAGNTRLSGDFDRAAGSSSGQVSAQLVVSAVNCSKGAGLIVDKGNNLIAESGTPCGLTDGVNGNIIGKDPNLGPLQNNGGPTLTHALPSDSPAVNAGNNSLASTLPFDQRGPGFPRLRGSKVDIGAFEYQPPETTSPVASPTQSPPANSAGWNNTDVTVNWNWSDEAGGSGIDTANCTLFSISSGEGTRTLSTTCKDNAGNTGSVTYSVKVDKTAPTIALASRLPAANGAGWNNTDVAVTWNCTDGLSGEVSSTVTRTVSTQGSSQSVTGTCTDNAGNTASNTVNNINIDKTAPTLSPSISPNPVPRFTSATATPNAADALSGLASSSCPAVSTSSLGSFSVTCTATDRAGNTVTASANYTVLSSSQALSNLRSQVQGLSGLGFVNRTLLLATLSQAQVFLSNGVRSGAVSSLNTFIGQVEGIRGISGGLTNAQANALIAQANLIIQSINAGG